MTTTEIVATAEQRIEREGEEAHAIHTQIVAALRDGRAAVRRLAEAFYEQHQIKGWHALGYESLGEYLGSPEIAYGKSAYFTLVNQHEFLIVQRKVDRERVEELEYAKVDVVMPALKAGAANLEDALNDVEALSKSDLIEKYRSKSVPEDTNGDDDPIVDDSVRTESEDTIEDDDGAGHILPDTDGPVRGDEVVVPARPPGRYVIQIDKDAWTKLKALPWAELEESLAGGAAYPRVDRVVLAAFVEWAGDELDED
jgi:hypothetical protein